jgi:hypothetical protein
MGTALAVLAWVSLGAAIVVATAVAAAVAVSSTSVVSFMVCVFVVSGLNQQNCDGLQGYQDSFLD